MWQASTADCVHYIAAMAEHLHSTADAIHYFWIQFITNVAISYIVVMREHVNLSSDSVDVILLSKQRGAYGGSELPFNKQLHVHVCNQWNSLRGDTAFVLTL